MSGSEVSWCGPSEEVAASDSSIVPPDSLIHSAVIFISALGRNGSFPACSVLKPCAFIHSVHRVPDGVVGEYFRKALTSG
jgi:hypothetical protein